MSLRLQTLAVPKGKAAFLCEICGKKATTKCEICRLTHYCSEYHKSLDFKSFHESVCQAIAQVREELPLPFSEEDRKEVHNELLMKKRDIQLLAEITTKKWLLHENAEYAYPPSMSALNIAKKLHGPKSIDAIYPTCLVSEVCLRLGDIKAAQDYNILAGKITQEFDKIPPSTLAQYHRLTGLICLTSKNNQLARQAFAECLYIISVEHGILDIRMAVAYGYLGLVLLRYDNEEGAMACFHKTADMWLEYLLRQYEDKTIRRVTEVEISSDEKIRELEFQYLESKIIIKWVYEVVRMLGMNEVTDLINFKILSIQALSQIKDGRPNDAIVYKHEALAVATRTKQDKAVSEHRSKILMDVLGDDYLLRWERKHNRPRTVATMYLEMIKKISF